MPNHHKPVAPAGEQSGPDEIVHGGGLILPGGKVDVGAILDAARRAAERRAIHDDTEAGESGDAESTDEDSGLPCVRFEIRRDLRKRLDRYLTDRITFMSRNQLQRLIDKGGVVVNGGEPKASTMLRAGDVVEVVIPPPPSKDIQPEDIPLDVLFEDAHLIVVNKAPDIIVHPARSHLKGTLLSALAFHFQSRSRVGGGLSRVGTDFARPGVVHRLDRHTSGCIVFAKQDEAHWKLGHQFEHRRVDKRYLAVVHGRIEPNIDVIELPLGPHPSREKGFREKFVVRHDELGKPSTTIFRVRERYKLSAPMAKEYTLVELELKTGRTHQIRVHLSHHDWPIVGDDMYGGKPFVNERGETIIARQALHACLLAFTHPITGEPMRFTAPVRGEMARLISELRRLSGGGERVETPDAAIDLAAAIREPA